MEHSGRNTKPNSRVEAIFVGAGAVGCFYASRLHDPNRGVHVSLVARSNYKVIASKGVSMRTHSFGDYSFKPRNVYPSVEAAAAGASDGSKEQRGWDYIFVTTKALPDYSDDSKMIEPLVGPTSCIVLIQNGLGVEEPFRGRFPGNPVVSAVTVVSAEQVSHGVIKQNRWTRISIGPYTNGLGSGDARLGMLGSKAVEWLGRSWGPEGGGIRDVEPHDEVGLQVIRWHKLCINAAFNPSAVLSGGRGNADMVNDSELREHLMGVMEEIWKAAPLILGRPFPKELASPERILKSTERNTGSKPSMLLDWEAGRPLELEVILGNPVRIARDHGVQMPRLQSLYALLKSAQMIRETKQKQGGQSML